MKHLSRKSVDLETFFLVGVVLLAALILLGSLQFSETARLYPFFTSIAVIVLATILLFQKHMPAAVRERLRSSEAEDEESVVLDNEKEEAIEQTDEEVNERSVAVMALIYGGYIVAVNVIGFLVSSMALMYVIQRYYDYGTRVKRALSVVLVGAFVYAGYIILDIDFDQGMIWNSLL